jgi:hypothetical protein
MTPAASAFVLRGWPWAIAAMLAIGLALWSSPALPHSSSNSFIEISQNKSGASIRIDVPIRDLDLQFDFDRDQSQTVTWQEIKAQQPAIEQWLRSGVTLNSGKKTCVIQTMDWAAARYGEENYLSVIAPIGCDQSDVMTALALRYRLFFDQDALHRGLVKATINDTPMSGVLSPDRPEIHLDPSRAGFLWTTATYLIEGVWHIWIGADHILFLLSLLLPCVFLRQTESIGHWQPIPRVRPAVMNVLAVVTAFTVAHSITLGLTVLEIIQPPKDFVEAIIAASVVVAALGNLTRRLIHLRWQIAFGFGLIHGFGFASVLSELGLPSDQLIAALLGFNVGVELGQLAIVAVFFPIAWTLRATALYRWGFMVAGSLAIAAIAAYWFIERIQ